MNTESALRRFFGGDVALGAEERIVVAFSGGPDSLALAWGFKRLSSQGIGRPVLCHVDHRLDPESEARARQASDLADRLDLPFAIKTRQVTDEAAKSRGVEAAAREARYRALEEVRTHHNARWIATAHHRDDQIETILLRLLYGSRLKGLGGMTSRRQQIVRPLLGLRRSQITDDLAQIPLDPIHDPTNVDPRVPRNRLRRQLLPILERLEVTSTEEVCRLATICREIHSRLESAVRSRIRIDRLESGYGIRRSELTELPSALRPLALDLLREAAGLPYPPRRAALTELMRQLDSGHRIGCDCGDLWRWESRQGYLILAPKPTPTPRFAYTLEVPGECELPALSMRFRMRREPVANWMFRPSSSRAALDLPLEPGDRVLLRNRRPGDRLTPFGCSFSKRLKDLLIDRRVPREERDKLPLLLVNRKLAWVPGVTIAEPFRITTGSEAWVAELDETL